MAMVYGYASPGTVRFPLKEIGGNGVVACLNLTPKFRLDLANEKNKFGKFGTYLWVYKKLDF